MCESGCDLKKNTHSMEDAGIGRLSATKSSKSPQAVEAARLGSRPVSVSRLGPSRSGSRILGFKVHNMEIITIMIRIVTRQI